MASRHTPASLLHFASLYMKNKIYQVSQVFLTKSLITEIVTSFFKDFFKGRNKDQFLAIIFVIEYADSSYRALGKLNVVKFSDLNKLLKVLHIRFETKGEEYHNLVASNIIISYKVMRSYTKDSIIHVPKKSISLLNRFTTFQGLRLPATTNILHWGDIISKDQNSVVIQSKEHNVQFHIQMLEDCNKITVMSGDVSTLR